MTKFCVFKQHVPPLFHGKAVGINYGRSQEETHIYETEEIVCDI